MREESLVVGFIYIISEMEFIRLAFGYILPPTIGAIIMALVAAYIFMGIPSLIHSVIVEMTGRILVQQKGKVFTYLIISCLLGFAAALLQILLFNSE